jgi:uncharacterized ion transporter superfamily protein YfcC
MQTQNQLMNFLIELIKRLKTKKPKFFVILQYITGLLGAVTGIPEFLAQFNIVLPPSLAVLENKYVAWASVGFLIASQLTTQSNPVTVAADGAVLKQTDATRLPFTATNEIKKAQVEEIPNNKLTLAEIKTAPK